LNKTTNEKIEILRNTANDWVEYNKKFKYGRFIKKFKTTKVLTTKELSNLPPKHDAHKNPNLKFTRTEYKEININQPLQECTNRVDFTFNSVYPEFNTLTFT